MPHPHTELTRAGLPIWTAVFVAFVCLTLLALSGLNLWNARETTLRNAEIAVDNLAQSLTQHADDTFELADTILGGLVNRLETQGTGPAALESLRAFMKQPRDNSRIRGIFVYGEDGRWLATTEPVSLAGRNNSDRGYFQKHKSSPDRSSYLGTPVKSRSGGQWVITISRRFNHPDGRFAGVALTTIDAAYFANFYQRFNVGEHGIIGLLNTDGFMMARSKDNDAYVGRDLNSSRLFQQARNHPSGQIYHYVSSIDGLDRLGFYQPSLRYPLAVIVTKTKDDVLAPWWRDALSQISFVVGIAIVFALIGLHLVRRLLERQRLAKALVSKEADFRLLAEQSSDTVMRIDFDERLTYVSPSCAAVLGWEDEQLVGTPALAGVHPDDLPRVRQTVEALKRGSLTETRVIYRNRHRTKGEVWLETAMRTTRNPQTGRIDGVVAITRDISEQKDLEQKLASLARSDSLTGLANRRTFDERLEEEWVRARRDNKEICLLMIDVDHYKKFNDRYGHQAGDECLRVVAKIIAQGAQRGTDIAARYGGEEFALLLPNTDENGGTEVAERIRKAMKDAAIAHADNVPSHVVTVSIGAAVVRPAASSSSAAASLVKAADNALYEAKNNGRDRVCMVGRIIPFETAQQQKQA